MAFYLQTTTIGDITSPTVCRRKLNEAPKDAMTFFSNKILFISLAVTLLFFFFCFFSSEISDGFIWCCVIPVVSSARCE